MLLSLDDDEGICDLVRTMGDRAGFAVTATTSPAAFRDSLQLLGPDVIVLDLQMPDIDGVQMLRFLAERNAVASILLVSGTDERTIASAEQYGLSRGLRMLSTLQKPFLPEDLLEKFLLANAATSTSAL